MSGAMRKKGFFRVAAAMAIAIALSACGGAGTNSTGEPAHSVAGSSSGTGAPEAPSGFLMTGQTASSISLSWTAASVGTHPIDHYRIYRNGVAYATTIATTYTDNNAPSATMPGASGAATMYSYAVSAVDTAGVEGPRQTQMTAWMYYNGERVFLMGDYSDVSAIYNDTSGGPEEGPYDIKVTGAGGGAGYAYYQPYSGTPGAPQWAMEVGAFNYMVIDVKPTLPNQQFWVNVISRAPTGGIYNKVAMFIPSYNDISYGPNPMVVGQWNHYKIPLNPQTAAQSLGMGKGQGTGYISGSTLAVTSWVSGVNFQPGSWLSGPGLAPNTWITAFGTGSGGVGTYTISPAQNVGSASSPVTLGIQRTHMFLIDLGDQLTEPNVYYFDNFGFTTE